MCSSGRSGSLWAKGQLGLEGDVGRHGRDHIVRTGVAGLDRVHPGQVELVAAGVEDLVPLMPAALSAQVRMWAAPGKRRAAGLRWSMAEMRQKWSMPSTCLGS